MSSHLRLLVYSFVFILGCAALAGAQADPAAEADSEDAFTTEYPGHRAGVFIQSTDWVEMDAAMPDGWPIQAFCWLEWGSSPQRIQWNPPSIMGRGWAGVPQLAFFQLWERRFTLDGKEAYRIGNIGGTRVFMFERVEGANDKLSPKELSAQLRDGLAGSFRILLIRDTSRSVGQNGLILTHYTI